MTREEILRMAREAGFEQSIRHDTAGVTVLPDAMFVRFAAMVAEVERAGCAKVCDAKALRCEQEAQRAIENGEHDDVSAIRATAWQLSVCGAEIRARSAA